jgi:LPS transport system D
VRVSGIAIAFTVLAIASVAFAQQSKLPADSMLMECAHAQLWTEGTASVIELHRLKGIELPHAKLTGDDAVVWITPSPGGLVDEQQIRIALIGHARLDQAGIVRMDNNLIVTARVSGAIRLIGERASGADSSSSLYRAATALGEGEPISPPATEPTAAAAPERQWNQAPPPSTAGPSASRKPPPPLDREVDFDRTDIDTTHRTDDGNIAFILTGGVKLRYRDAKGNLLEFVADSGVLFTDLKTLKGTGLAQDKKFLAEHVKDVYFEGDVRVFTTPADQTHNSLTMEAEHVYYDLETDRAVMTDVAFHSVDLKQQVPFYMRAKVMRQLSEGEFRLKDAQLTTSAFAVPTYDINASEIYVHTEATGDPDVGDRVTFSADSDVLDAFGVPIFYLPKVAGTMTSRGEPVRGLSLQNSSNFGFGVHTQFGLLESLGQPPPKDVDASYTLDYFDKRGPAGGLDAKYEGGFVTETTKDPWNFLGDLHSYFVDDHGTDVLGGARPDVKPSDEFRGRAYIEHQNFLPDDWQMQLRLGWVSDANFLTQWFPDEFNDGLPIDESVYLKRQHDSEVFYLLGEGQPNNVVTTADSVQEQREVERLPEVGYDRVGDSIADDKLTFFSDNSIAGLKFDHSTATLAEQGYSANISPGLPAYAYTGDPDDATWRGDAREEIDWPIDAGPFKVVPFAFGRYTSYSQGVAPPAITPTVRTIPTTVDVAGAQNRVMAGAGVRLTTTFWKVDDSAESDLFDIHRLRHVIEPELDLFTSAQNIDQNRLFIYDPTVDAVNDVQAVQLALRQRWQTKRGGPGRWRSVDLFTFDVYADLYANQPATQFRDPADFRGLFFSSLPEASLPRNSINADALWRISDSTAVLSDMSENLDYSKLATASIGVAVQRDERLSYFFGLRYLADLDSNVATAEVNYEVSRKYSVALTQSFDFGQSHDVYYSFSLIRKFDRFAVTLRSFYDQTSHESGVSFSVQPFGLRGLGTDQLANPG